MIRTMLSENQIRDRTHQEATKIAQMNQNEGLMEDASSANGKGRAKLEVIKQHLSAVQQKICPCCLPVYIVEREQNSVE